MNDNKNIFLKLNKSCDERLHSFDFWEKNRKIICMCSYYLFILFLFLPITSFATLEIRLQEANQSYQEGENADTYEMRQRAFNHSLQLYSQLASEKVATSPSIDKALANLYFQFGEYAWAILYSYRALQEHPEDSTLLATLQAAQEKIGLPIEISKTPQLTSHIWYRGNLWWLVVLTFFTVSAAIWFSGRWIQISAAVCFLLFSLCVHFLYVYYSTPLEGILIHSTGLYRTATEHSELVHVPLLSGSKVRILQMTQNCEWIKIINDQSDVGYVRTSYVRIL